MKLSQIFNQTLRKAPAEVKQKSHELLLRAGFVLQHNPAVFSYMPLALQVFDKLEKMLRHELAVLNAQEIRMPFIQPATIWFESGRGFQSDISFVNASGQSASNLILAKSYEETLAKILEQIISSYRQLPAALFHFSSHWRQKAPSGFGLFSSKENFCLNWFALEADESALNESAEKVEELFQHIFEQCELSVKIVESDSGWRTGTMTREFVYLMGDGPDNFLICKSCGYAASEAVAQFQRPVPPNEDLLPLQKVATPDSKTIEDVAAFLNVPTSKTAKAVFMMATIAEAGNLWEKFVFAVVRGDMEVNESRLANAVGAQALRPATEDEIRAVHAEPGYASPIGLKNVLIVADELIPNSPNLVTGANEAGYHFINSNYGRDYEAAIVADIVSAKKNYSCKKCGSPLQAAAGASLGKILHLADSLAEKMNVNYLDASGKSQPVWISSYELNLTRLLACVVDAHHDDWGMMWPRVLAPFQVHLVVLAGKNNDPEIVNEAQEIYETLQAAGLEVLLDDRPESPGVKFNDADLIGIPVRLTVSARARQEGGVEFKLRDQKEKTIVRFPDVLEKVRQAL